MDADEDPGGPIHPTMFYGLWPRFPAEEDSDDPAEAEPAFCAAD
jgi:hypothetical protein